MRLFIALFTVLSFTTIARGQSPAWPQFRGPGASGIAEDEKPPVEVGPDKNVKWKVPAPAGLSSPIIVGERLVITAFDGGKLYTIAYNRADGSELWRAEAPFKQLEPYHATEGSPAASTSASDGERIVSYFGSCGLFCYDLSGKEIWKHEMPPAATAGDFGTGVSPVIADGTVILVRDEMTDPKIIAIDLATGKPKWEKKRESKSGYATPAVWQTSAGTQIAVPGLSRMIGYDLTSGDEKWYVEGMPSAACASPVTANGDLFFAGWSPGDPTEADSFKMPTFDQLIAQTGDDNKDGLVSKEEAADSFLNNFFSNQDMNKDGQITRQEWDTILQFMAASRNSAFALKPGGSGDVTESHVRWKKKKGLPYVPTAILYRGQYVMVKDGGIVTAYDAETGDEIYQRRAIASGNYYASPVAAGGKIYFTSLDEGIVTVLKGGADKPEKVAENPPLGERVAATPAIVDDTIYIRTAGHLYAFAEDN
jgi:outer membrane protein assembly factor BamB